MNATTRPACTAVFVTFGPHRFHLQLTDSAEGWHQLAERIEEPAFGAMRATHSLLAHAPAKNDGALIGSLDALEMVELLHELARATRFPAELGDAIATERTQKDSA